MVETLISFLKWDKLTTLLLILSLIVSIIPANLVFLLSSEKSSLESDDISNTHVDNSYHIPRLMATYNNYSKNSYYKRENSSKLSEFDHSNNIPPTFAIGSQSGNGSGTYEAKDSAILASNINLDVENGHWRSHPEEHENSITITIPSGYTNQSGYLNISGVTALPDWRLVENATTGAVFRQSDSFYEAAQEFTIGESHLNLTKVYLYIDMVDTNNADNLKPNGEFLVLGDNSGEPDSTNVKATLTLEDHSTLSGLSDGGSWSAPTNGWLQYTFSPAIHLTEGTYWLVLNDTGEGGDGYWRWYTQDDGSGNPDKGEWNFKLLSHSAAWTEGANLDMVIMPQVLPVEFVSSSYLNKKYPSPQSLEFLYRTSTDDTNLTSFSWFQWNGTTDNAHYFLTNTSVNFTLSWRINITYSNNPLSVFSSYLTNNDSITIWNMTFSTSSISTSYNIRNRTITVNGLENDWNGSAIYLDNSLEFNTSTSGGINASVIYSNQSSSMVINASSLTAAKDWKILLDAPNYLLNFTFSRNDTPLSLPYRIFNMNEYNLTFIVGEPGNLTYWIDYPNGTQVLQKNNIDDSQTTITDIWNVNSTLDQITNVNGTYNLQAFWNNSDKTKVGTFTRNLDVFINTSFSVQAESHVVVGQLFNVSTYYTSIHNNSDVQDAIIFCESNWTDNVYMNQIGNSYYNASFNTDGRNAGETGTITITTLVPWFVNWTQEISVIFVRPTSIEARDAINSTLLTNETSTYYRYYSASYSDNFSIVASYYDEITTSSLNVTTDPIVESDVSILVYKKKDPDSYNWTFEFNGSLVGSFLINITFSLEDYVPSTFQIRYVIRKANTAIISEITETYILWNNSYDFALVVNNTNHNENITLYTSDEIDINDTTKVQFLNQQGDKYWFRFAPTTLPIEIYDINITFFHNYVQNSSIIVTFTVINRPTNVEARDAFNNTLLTNKTSMYARKYSASYSDNFSIIVSYYDQETTAILNSTTDPIVEIDGSILVYKKKDTVSYNWTFEFNGSMVGSFLINITFSLDNHTSATFQIQYVITKASTAIISEITEANILWNNSYDFALVVNNTNHNENITLYTSDEIDINDTTKVQFLNQQGDKYWFRFAPTALPLGNHDINITFFHSNFQNSSILASFTVINRPTGIEARDTLNNTLLANETSTYYRQYSTGLSDTFSILLGYYDEETGLILNTTSDPLVESDGSVFVYTTKDPVSYNWTLVFNGTVVGSFLINITFTLENYTAATFQIRYILFRADTAVISEIKQTSFYWNESYDFALVVNNTNYNENVTVYISDNITIDYPSKVSFLNQTTERYWFRFAPTALPLGNHDINITFSHSNFQNSSILASFTVINRPTGIEARDALNNTLLANETSSYYRQYSTGDSDTFSIILGYYDEETGAILNTTGDHLVESDGSVLVYTTKDPVSYNWTFVFNGTAVGSFLINITFTLDNYTASTFQIRYVLSKADTAVISEISQTSFYWNESYDFALVVNNTNYNENVTLYTSTDITIDYPGKVAFLNRTAERYWFRFAPAALPLGNHDINITFSHSYFQNSSIVASFTVINRPTGVEARDALNNTLLANVTSTYSRQYSTGDSDTFSIILGYYDEETGSILNTTSDPSVKSDGSILVYATKDPVSYNWTFVFNGTAVGDFLINITFTLDNYTASTFQIRYVLSKANTTIISEISQTTFYWNDSSDFALIVNNTNHNENITLYTSTDITSDYPTKIIFLNRTAERYWFRFAPTALPLGNHDINITFSHSYFQNSSIITSFTVIKRLTGIEARDALNNTLLANETSTYFHHYSAGQSDNFSIILGYYDEETGAILNTASDPLVEADGSVLVYATKDPISYNWTLIFNGTVVGSFLINVTFTLDNYIAATFQVRYIISKATIAVISEIVQTSFYWNDSYDFALVVNNTNHDENVTLYTSTDITIDYPTKIIFLNRTGDRYWFRFAPTALAVSNHNINITFSHAYFQDSSILASFTVTNRPTGIEGRDALNNTLLTNETSTYYRQYSAGQSDNFSIIFGYYDEETGTILNTTNDPLVEADGSVLVYATKDPISYNWTLIFNGTGVGSFLINITFSLDNYTAATFQVRYIIFKATTAVISEIVQTSFYWNDSYDFALIVNNTNYNENVTHYTSTDIIIDFPAKVAFLNRTAERYWFRFAPSPISLGFHDINITFFHAYFHNSSILVSYVVTNRPTGIEARDALNNTLLTNETSTYYRQYSTGHSDNFSIILGYYDKETGAILNTTNDPLVEADGSVLVYATKDPISYNWTFIFNGTVVGGFLINITFTLDNYTAATFQVQYIISKVTTAVISEIAQTSFYWNDSYDFALVVNNTNYNENVTLYTSNDITIDNPTKVAFLNRTAERYWFRFAPSAVPLGIHDINITFSHAYFHNSSILVSFVVTNRPTGMEARDAFNNTLLTNETSTYYRQYSAGQSDNFSIILGYYDEETGAILNTTSDPLVESDGSILVYATKDPVSYNWTFIFNGTVVGSFLINITFSLNNYTAATFQVPYSLSKADTAVISEISQTSFYWNDSYDFALAVNNTNHDESVTLYTSTDITIDYPTKIIFLNRTGDRYWFRFAPSAIPLGNHDINITFFHAYFQTSSIITSFTVVNRPTSIEARDAINNTLLTNETSTYYRHFSTGHSDNFSIILGYYDEETGVILNTTSDPLVEADGSVLIYATKDPISYNWTLIFNGTMVGSFLINITFSLDNYTAASFQVRYIILKATTSVISEVTQTSFYWNESYDFALVVNNTNYNENITLYTSTDIIIDYPAKVAFLNRTADRYWFRFAPTALAVSNHDINITFSHPFFQNSSIIASFTVIKRPTGIEARDALNNTLLTNETSIYYRQYSTGHSDNFSIILGYYDEETGTILNTSNDPLVEADGSVLVYATKDPISYNWTLIFNGTVVGNLIINITFTLDNYTAATFQVRYIISKATTAVISEIAQTSFYWNDSYDFALVVNNTNYNENITFYTSTDITIDYPAKVAFLNRTVDKYWFRFSPSPVTIGIHDINITFSHAYFQNSSILVSFEVINRPTGIEARDALNNTLLTNETTIYYRQYSASQSDNFSIILGYYDEETGTILNTTSDLLVESDASVLIYATKDPISYNWTLIFNGTAIGNFLINITFTLDNYTTTTFQVRYIISKAPTAVISEIVQTSIYWNDSYDFVLIVNNTNYNENVTLYTSTDITIDYSAKVAFLNRTVDKYWFRFAPSSVPLGFHDINVTFSHAYFQNSSILISFEVINRPTGIEARDALNNTLLTNETSTYYRQYSAGHSDNFSIILGYYDEEIGVILNTATDPLVESDASVLVYATKDPISYNWTFIFNGSVVGILLVNITFNLDNYTAATFQVRYVLSKADTAIISEIAQTSFYWNKSYDFALIVNNTNYNENITLYTSTEITIDYTAKVAFLNRTADRYWFRFAPTALTVSNHDINITFSHAYFQTRSIITSFTVVNRPTSIEARDALNNTLLTNETSTYYRQYSAGHSDNFSIILGYYDEEIGVILNTTSDPLVEADGSVLIYATKDPISYNWTLIFNGTVVGNFIIKITFTLDNYTTSTFQVRYVLSKADTIVISEVSQTSFIWNESHDFVLVVNNTAYNENVTLYTSAEITIDYPAKVAFLNRTVAKYWFRFAPTALAVSDHDINITFSHAYFQNSSILVSFEVINRPTSIEARDALNNTLLTNETSTYYRQYSTGLSNNFSNILGYYDEETGAILNTTSDPLVEADGSVLIYATKDPISYNWTFIFNGTVVGNFLINITFTLDNYTTTTFQVRYIISKATTAVISEIAQTSIYWNDSYDFVLIVNNTNYNENVTLYTSTDITIDYSAKVAFLNRTVDKYWFRFAPTALAVSDHDINITFSHAYFQNSSILVSFTVSSRPTNIEARDAFNKTLLNNETSTYYRQYSPNNYDNFSILIKYYDSITEQTLNVSEGAISIQNDSTITVNYWKEILSYNWTFVIEGSVIGNYIINLTFSLANYTSVTFSISYVILEATTKIENRSIEPVPSINNVKSEEMIEFWLIWQSTYDEPINASNGVIINGTDMTLIETDPSTGNHTFLFTRATLGTITYNLTFIVQNYTKYEFLIRLNIFNRTMIITEVLSHPGISQLINLSYGEIYYFNVFLNDSETLNPINASVLPTPTHIRFLDIKSEGNHSFQFNASQAGNFLNLTIIFFIQNYETIQFKLSFIVALGEMVLNTSFSSHGNDSIIDTLQYGEIYNFTIFLNDNRTSFPISGTPISPSPTNFVFTGISSPGNHSFSYEATTVGTFASLEIIISLPNYNNFSYLITFKVHNREFLFNRSLSTHENDSIVDTLQYGDIYSFTIFLTDNRTSLPINGIPITPLPANIAFTGISSLGNHTFSYEATTVGTFASLEIIINLPNYNNFSYFITFIIHNRDFFFNASLSTNENDSIIDKLQYGDIYNFTIFLTDNKTSQPISGTPVTPLPANIAFTGISSKGNHTFSYEAVAIGNFASLEIVISLPNYNNFSYLVTFIVHNREFLFNRSLSTHENESIISTLQYGDIHTFSIYLVDNQTEQPINGTPISPLPTNIAFTGISSPGNHSFSYDATTVGTFASLEIIINLPNYNNFSYLITFIVHNREFLFNRSLSTHENESIISTLQYGDIHTFSIYLVDNQTGQPIIGTPITLSQIVFVGISSPGNHTFSYEAIEVGTFPSLEIRFTLLHYTDISYVLSFIIHNRVFVINEELSRPNNNSDQIIHYSEIYYFSIFLIDNRTGIPVNISPSLIELPDNITLDRISPNGNYTFKFKGETVNPFLLFVITFTQPHYNNVTYIIKFNITPMSTYTPEIHYQSELIVGEFLTISGEEWVAINNENVSITEIKLLNGSIPISFSPSDVKGFPFAINIATEDFKQGFHNLTLTLSSYGYENHSLSVPIVIIGRDIQITISVIPEEIKQGSEFRIEATLKYAPLVLSNSGVGAAINLASLEGVEVLLTLDILYENGSSITSRYTTTTNATGSAIFTVDGKYTVAAEGIQKITVVSAATPSGKAALQTTPDDFLETHRFEKQEEIDFSFIFLLAFIGFLIVSSTLVAIGGMKVKKTRKQKRIDSEKIIDTQDISGIKKELPSSDEGIITSPKRLQAKTALGTISKDIEEATFDTEKITDVSTWMNLFPEEFSNFEKEIKFIFNVVMKRKGRWVGQTSINYLVKNAPSEITTENLKILFTNLPKETNYFKKERSLIMLTSEGKKLALSILKEEKG